MVRVYTLYRVSTVGQVDHDDIPMQRIACREFVESQPDWTKGPPIKSPISRHKPRVSMQ